MSDVKPHAVVLFDGVCNLCNASVNFIIDRDPDAYFQFAPLQSEVGQSLIAGHDVRTSQSATESVLLLENGRVYSHSDAALRIAGRLRGPVKVLAAARVVPSSVRDAVYRWIARNRYRWFGRAEACRRPTPALKQRFLA